MEVGEESRVQGLARAMNFGYLYWWLVGNTVIFSVCSACVKYSVTPNTIRAGLGVS